MSRQIPTFYFPNGKLMEQISIPRDIISIKFPENYNMPIKKIPEHIEVLDFGNEFNQSLEFLESNTTLKKLILGENFKQSFDYIPSTIIYLHIHIHQDIPINFFSKFTKIQYIHFETYDENICDYIHYIFSPYLKVISFGYCLFDLKEKVEKIKKILAFKGLKLTINIPDLYSYIQYSSTNEKKIF